MKLFHKKFADKPWFKFYEGAPKHIDCPDTSMFEQIRQTSLKYPNLIAYTYYDRYSTYARFIKDIEDCSKSFKQLGIVQGDVVTICMPNTPEGIISFYALNRIGAIANMIHPLSSEGEIKMFCNMTKSKAIVAIDFNWEKIQAILADTNIKTTILVSISSSMGPIMRFGFWLTKGRKIKKADQITESLMYWKEFVHLGKRYKDKIDIAIKGSDPAVILHSGGTTGKPKGILLSNLNFNSVVLQELAICKALDRGVSILSIMPIFHGFGLGSSFHACFCVGGRSIILPQFNAKKFDELLKKYKPNIITGVPTLFEALINNKNMNNVNLSHLTCALCGGDTLSPSLKSKIDTFLKEHHATIEVRTAYGLTECVSGTCMMPFTENRVGSIGIPCPDSYVKIVEPGTRDELPTGKDGEICISGPSVMIGYINEEKETSQVLQMHNDGKLWLHTGDIGCMDSDGFVYFKQRLKRMIVSSGYNIYPQHIENTIEEHPAVLTCTVIGIPHPYKVQVAKAFIVLREGIEITATIKKSIKDYCKKNIAKYAMPYEFEYRKSLPRTKVGKIAYNDLLEEEKKKHERSHM